MIKWGSVQLDTCSVGQGIMGITAEKSRGLRKKMHAQVMTERQARVLAAIREHRDTWGVPPTRSELARRLGYAHGSGVDGHLKSLERRGILKINKGMDRGIQLLREGLPVFELDRLHEVAAGEPLVVDESKAVMRIPDTIAGRLHPRADWYLIVRGDSQDRVGIKDGDIVAIQENPDPSEGELVMVRIEESITLKRFHRTEKGMIELQPQSTNPEHKSIEIDEETPNWGIVGVVVGAMIGSPSATS